MDHRRRIRVATITTFLCFAACSSDGQPTQPEPSEPASSRPTLVGDLPVLGGTSASGVYLVLEGTGIRDSIPLQPNGAFEAGLPEELVGARVWLRVSDQSDAVYPSLSDSITVATGATRVDGYLVPRSWRVQMGAWAGRSIPIDLHTAVGERVAVGSNYLQGSDILDRVNTAGWDAWAPGDFPIPVWFAHGLPPEASGYESGGDFSAADSVAFWAALDEMERRYGRDLFRPARIEEFPRDSVRETAASGHDGFMMAFAPKTISARLWRRPGSNSSYGGIAPCWALKGQAVHAYCTSGIEPEADILYGTVRVGVHAALNAHLVQALVVYALYFGHTNHFCSVALQSRDRGDGPNGSGRWDHVCPSYLDFAQNDPFHGGTVNGISDADVAYFELNLSASNEHRLRNITVGLAQAVVGERYLRLGESLERAWQYQMEPLYLPAPPP